MTIVPRRGGNHILLGIYRGGTTLTSEYKLKQDTLYQSTTQLLNPKVLDQCDTALPKAREDTTLINLMKSRRSTEAKIFQMN